MADAQQSGLALSALVLMFPMVDEDEVEGSFAALKGKSP